MNQNVIALCALSSLATGGALYLIFIVRISRMKARFRKSALLLAGPDLPQVKIRGPFQETMTIEERTAQLKRELRTQ